jgi:hypothetical protein
MAFAISVDGVSPENRKRNLKTDPKWMKLARTDDSTPVSWKESWREIQSNNYARTYCEE